MNRLSMNKLGPVIHSLVFACAIAFVGVPAQAKTLLHNIELDWRPTPKALASRSKAPVAGLTVQLGQFGDTRDNRQLIGENREEADEGTVLPVSTVTDVPAWIGQYLKEVLRQNGVNVVESGGTVILDGDVQRFFVTETNNYQANIGLHLRARDTSGAVLWETNLSANESRFGRSYKKENYTELLSDTLINLAQVLLGNAQFRDALNGVTTNSGKPAPYQPVDNGPTAQDPIVE